MRENEKPTVRQAYALAGALCERAGEGWPETRGAASELLERLRIENGHPAQRLEETPWRPPPRYRRRGRGRRRWRGRSADRLASLVAAKLAEELR